MEEKKAIERYIKQMFVIARIAYEDNALPKDEIEQFIVDKAKMWKDKIDNMSTQEFMLFCLQELAGNMSEIIKKGI